LQSNLCSLSFCFYFHFQNNKNGNVFLFSVTFLNSFLKKSMKHRSCRIDLADSIKNSYVMAQYDFDNPIYQAEEESEEDCDLPKELARLLKQEERVIQPHQ